MIIPLLLLTVLVRILFLLTRLIRSKRKFENVRDIYSGKCTRQYQNITSLSFFFANKQIYTGKEKKKENN
jgi:hypothetical protein